MTARSFPTLVGETLGNEFGGRQTFPFIAWATSSRFEYPEYAKDFLANCGSAVEAYFARAYVVKYEPQITGAIATGKGSTVELQARSGPYYIDALVRTDETSLAIEIDGLGFHRMTKEQVAADYLKQRRLVLKGHVVIRFTAQEVLKNPEECWRQVEAILAARRKK